MGDWRWGRGGGGLSASGRAFWARADARVHVPCVHVPCLHVPSLRVRWFFFTVRRDEGIGAGRHSEGLAIAYIMQMPCQRLAAAHRNAESNLHAAACQMR
jgi:hypothetical protein